MDTMVSIRPFWTNLIHGTAHCSTEEMMSKQRTERRAIWKYKKPPLSQTTQPHRYLVYLAIYYHFAHEPMNYRVNVKSNRIISLKCHLRREPAVIRLAYGYEPAVVTVNWGRKTTNLVLGPELYEWRQLRLSQAEASRLHGCTVSLLLSMVVAVPGFCLDFPQTITWNDNTNTYFLPHASFARVFPSNRKETRTNGTT